LPRELDEQLGLSTLVLDGVVAHVLATVRARVGRLLARRHLEPADDTRTGETSAGGSAGALA
jgi:hypothetical protein